ncbi:MAG: NrsF family protein [Sandaracinaceae bacterium]
MSELRDMEDLDPTLEGWLADVRDDEETPDLDLDAMLTSVKGDIAEAEQKKSFWFKTRPTWVRRAVALGAALTMVMVGGIRALRDDLSEVPVATMALAVGGLAVLLGLSVHQALRPIHQPRSRWVHVALIGLTLGCTFLLAVLSPHQAHDESFLSHVSPCIFYGLFMALPVYLVIRLLDRGASTGALLAACAAGLLGNLVQQLHCPRSDMGHLMASHFGLVVLFVAGLGMVHVITGRRAG